MEGVRKTFFNPLASTKEAIRQILQELPVGSAHPYSPERILLCRTAQGIKEIDISESPESYFFSAVDLGEMGEVLIKRMAAFNQLKLFEEYAIQQAPASTFAISIPEDRQILMFAISERTPTYYDFCFANASQKVSCWNARTTFRGLYHSGDHNSGTTFLAYAEMEASKLVSEELCVFISGYQNTPITRFLGTHPAVLVANHAEKVLYIVPVPLDKATIGNSTLCCPLVMKRNGNELICSILPTATTDVNKMASGPSLDSTCFAEAITRAELVVSVPEPTATATATTTPNAVVRSVEEDTTSSSMKLPPLNAVVASNSIVLPDLVKQHNKQIIRFGTGLEFAQSDKIPKKKKSKSTVVLPCVLGDQLEGPLLLATGTIPANVPFHTQSALHNYYEKLESLVVFLDDQMTDNARNLAGQWRLNSVFVVQLKPEKKPMTTTDVVALLNEANINSVTAVAGPQSLVLIQIFDNYYFYRGLANRQYLDSADLSIGTDMTKIVNSTDIHLLLDPRSRRLINLADSNSVLMVSTGDMVRVDALETMMKEMSVYKIESLKDDISAIVPQLQVLLDQKHLQELSKRLVAQLSSKISTEVGPLRKIYINFLTGEFDRTNSEHVKQKNKMLGELRKTTLDLQRSIGTVITSLATMMSAQTTSKRTHDLKRLLRQAQITGNVEAAKSMTFETLAGYLETHAADMGVLIMNVKESGYAELLSNLKGPKAIEAASACDLDTRILHLPGFDAGIILEQSQAEHHGPLSSQLGSTQPTLALPYLSQNSGSGSTLAWVCWDEFVDLKSPYKVRWMEKCNEGHIAAIRILTRSTLANAIASREHNLQSNSVEVGNLMAALLLATMGKLAAMRTTAPKLVDQADDTSIKLMRGLFGNFLTIAGSGVRPFSMVWQLFGTDAQFDVPTTDAEWHRYQQVVKIYPYTGWPLEIFYSNLACLLDKLIIRVATKGENVSAIKDNRMTEMIKFCKLRNIQLEHSRSIITVLQRMLMEKNEDVSAIASRLLKRMPAKLNKQSQSYSRIINYLRQLAKNGERDADADRVIASVYVKRSAAFAKCKSKILKACREKDCDKIKERSQALLDEHAKIAKCWEIDAASFTIQNIDVYKELATATAGETASKLTEHTQTVASDAELNRVPWQIGKHGEFGPEIEPLDEAFVHEMLTGQKLDIVNHDDVFLSPQEQAELAATSTGIASSALVVKTPEDELTSLGSVLVPSFVHEIQACEQPTDVCKVLGIPKSVLQTFARALAPPDFSWKEDLVKNFKTVIVSLLKERTNREQSRPAARLFGRKNDVEVDSLVKLLSMEDPVKEPALE